MNAMEFRPTAYDSAIGAFFDDDDPRRGWIVAPVSRTRDTGPLEESNFEAALANLGGESETCEVHRYRHWGPGWFEVILVAPERSGEVDRLAQTLEDYPVLDEDDLSRREWEQFEENWELANRDYVSALATRCGLSDLAKDALDNLPADVLLQAFMESCPSGDYYDGDAYPRFEYVAETTSRATVAALIRQGRHS